MNAVIVAVMLTYTGVGIAMAPKDAGKRAVLGLFFMVIGTQVTLLFMSGYLKVCCRTQVKVTPLLGVMFALWTLH